VRGLVLAGGTGSRLRPLTDAAAKQLLPVANVPVLFYGLDALSRAGITDVGIVLGDTGDDIRAAVGDGGTWGISVTYIPQDAPRGLADCVLIARPFLGDEDFIVYLGDTLVGEGLASFTHGFDARASDAGASARLLLAEVDDAREFGVATLGPDGRITALVEKPAVPPSNLAVIGCYAFTSAIHQAVRAISPSERGELELTDAIQWLIDQGHVVGHRVLQDWWTDVGTFDALLRANGLVLRDMERQVDGEVDSGSRIEGAVRVERGARITSSSIEGPAIIGAGAVITGSRVGPFTSVGSGCHVTGSTIDDSILLRGSCVEGVDGLTRSIIGQQATVRRSDRPRVGLVIGDGSQVDLATQEQQLDARD
jgi:glucose-1-phosphate thymidylyltransferase